MPTHGSAATPDVQTSSATFTAPKPSGLVDNNIWFVCVSGRGNVNVTTPPTGFDLLASASGNTGTTASSVKAAVYAKKYGPGEAAGAPASVSIVMSANVFGTCFSWRANGGASTIATAIVNALVAADTDNTNTFVSPAITPSVGNTLRYNIGLMLHPTDGFAAGIIDVAGPATELHASPAIAIGTNRVSGNVAWEDGPDAGVSSGTRLWTVGGATWGPALGITILVADEALTVVGGSDQTVESGELVTLDASGTIGADSLTWSLLSGSYPAAHMIPVGLGIVEFIAPTGPATLVFRCTGVQGTTTGTDDVTITVTPATSGIREGYIVAGGQATY